MPKHFNNSNAEFKLVLSYPKLDEKTKSVYFVNIAPITLAREPIGWDGLKPKLTRTEFHGFPVGFTGSDVTLTFDKDTGVRAHLKQHYNTYASNAIAVLQMWAGGQLLYEGELDFHEYRNRYEGEYEVTSLSLSQVQKKSKHINNKENEITLSSSQSLHNDSVTQLPSVLASLHSNVLASENIYKADSFLSTSETRDLLSPSAYLHLFASNIPTEYAEIKSSLDNLGQIQLAKSGNDQSRNLIIFDEDSDITIVCDISGTIRDQGLGERQGDFHAQLEYWAPGATSGTVLASDPNYTASPTYNGGDPEYSLPYRIQTTQTLSAKKGGALMVALRIYNHFVEVDPEVTFVNETKAGSLIYILKESIAEASNSNAFLAYEALSNCLTGMTGENHYLRSNFFGRDDYLGYPATGCGANNLITNGYKLRNFEDKPIQSNLTDLYDGLNMRYMLGRGWEQDDYCNFFTLGIVDDTKKELWIEGNPQLLKPGDVILLSGMSANNDGAYTVAAVNSDPVGPLQLSFTNPYAITINETFTDPLTQAVNIKITSTQQIDVLRVEEMQYFYKDQKAFELEDIDFKTFEEFHNVELAFTSIEFGYRKYESDGEKDSASSFNTKASWTTPVRIGNKELQKISPLIADGIAIEVTRRLQFKGTPTESHKYDDDNFIIAAISEGLEWRAETNEDFEFVEGVASPETQYNLKHIPRLAVFDWAPFYSSLGYPPKSKFNQEYVNAFYKNNGDLNFWQKNHSCLREDKFRAEHVAGDPLRVGNMSAPIFGTKIFEIQAPMNFEQFQEIEEAHKGIGANAYGYIEFTDPCGEVRQGYLMELELNDNLDKAKLVLWEKYTDSIVEEPYQPPISHYSIDANAYPNIIIDTTKSIASRDVAATITNMEVDWGDGNSDTGVLTFHAHTYTTPGRFLISLTITDSLGKTDSFETWVVVA